MSDLEDGEGIFDMLKEEADEATIAACDIEKTAKITRSFTIPNSSKLQDIFKCYDLYNESIERKTWMENLSVCIEVLQKQRSAWLHF